MKRLTLVLTLCLVFATIAYASPVEFRNVDDNTKEYVIENLAKVVRDHKILLVQFRPGIFCSAENKEHIEFMHLFRLFEFVNLGYLKPCVESKEKFICLDLQNFSVRQGLSLWRSKRNRSMSAIPRPYRPAIMSSDEYVRLVFAENSPDWNKKELDFRAIDVYEHSNISNKDRKLQPSQLVEKYCESEFFSNKVARIAPTCIFQVDVEPPEIDSPEIHVSLQPVNRDKDIMDARRDCNLIHLSHTEVSEIVYLAYRLKGYKDGRAEYKKACAKNPQILKPVEKLQTEIGRMLAEELYPKGLAEFRDGGKSSTIRR